MNRDYSKDRNPKGVVIYPPWMEDYIKDYIDKYIKDYPWDKPDKPEDNDKEDSLKVKIKSVIEDEFVVVESDDYLYATGKKSNENGIFKIIMLDDDKVKIRLVGGDFIRVDDRDFLVADSNKKNATKFRLYKVDNKEYVLKAPNGYYVRVRDKDKRLVARAEGTGKRTIFKFKTIE